MKYTKEIGRKLLECLPEEYVAVVCDKNGECYAYSKVPITMKDEWYSNNGGDDFLLMVYEKNPDWKDSLIVREKWVPQECELSYIALPDNLQYCTSTHYLTKTDKHLLQRNLIFRTKEEAIKRAKEMLGEVE